VNISGVMETSKYRVEYRTKWHTGKHRSDTERKHGQNRRNNKWICDKEEENANDNVSIKVEPPDKTYVTINYIKTVW